MKIEAELLSRELDNHHFSTLICFNKEEENYSKQPVYNSKGFKEAIAITKLTEEYTGNVTLFFRVTVYKAWTAMKLWLSCTI